MSGEHISELAAWHAAATALRETTAERDRLRAEVADWQALRQGGNVMAEPSLGDVIIHLERLLAEMEGTVASYRLAIAVMKVQQIRRTEGGRDGAALHNARMSDDGRM